MLLLTGPARDAKQARSLFDVLPSVTPAVRDCGVLYSIVGTTAKPDVEDSFTQRSAADVATAMNANYRKWC